MRCADEGGLGGRWKLLIVNVAGLKSRRSITGVLFMCGGGAVACKSKVQAAVAASSTEAEFIASVSAAKTAKYLRSALKGLGFPEEDPAPLYVDDKAAIDVINQDKPTPRSRHIDIQHFAIQEWRAKEIIRLFHIAGVLNASDQATKALGWILHHRHARRGVGHFGVPKQTPVRVAPFERSFHLSALHTFPYGMVFLAQNEDKSSFIYARLSPSSTHSHHCHLPIDLVSALDLFGSLLMCFL